MRRLILRLRDEFAAFFNVQIRTPWWTSPGNLWDWASERWEQRRAGRIS